MDDIWEIDILKKEASPPRNIRNRLSSIIPRIVDIGKARHRTRASRTGHNITGSDEPFWIRKTNGGKVSYIVNLKNKYVAETLGNDNSLKTLFCLLEKEFPYESVYHDGAVRDSKFDKDYESDDEKKEALKFAKFIIKAGGNVSDLGNTNPFKRKPELLKFIKENI